MAKSEKCYFAIIGSFDGGCSLQQLTKEELLKKITPNQHGETDWNLGENRMILSSPPEEIDNFTDILIIKGEIVTPHTKKVVTEFDVQ